ncbi:two-component response regulator (response receiver domain/LuxR regulator domain) [Desulforapulum autotrophicum HRM2]|uniref:Two-component response regulator (Response receiver domain/LuxR regulator domain) n=1 Tax=Desulforapulum autotrophicum (strain ATCC 43914 / DSM 3382 / VKM B-1955 / HRM2) TaxID=177437 RepID=C0QFX9_DESAH|nr:response regulator transcription factor [Desulforapulum autotrophicum]ACN15547.1 two-component response regulator (response receiver domain/LuxR regulator domain) [Desulforapulum autotrophicum HRM2]
MEIVIVEDQRQLLTYYTILLTSDPDIKSVIPCTILKQAIRAFQAGRVDIFITCLGKQVATGIERIKTIKSRYPETEILVHSTKDNPDTVLQAFRAGASGYLLKGGTPVEFLEAVHVLYSGGVPLTPVIARIIIHHLHANQIIQESCLTPREIKILKLMEQGLTYKEISSSLSIGIHSVHSQVKKIHSKLKAANRREAFAKAKKKGLI